MENHKQLVKTIMLRLMVLAVLVVSLAGTSVWAGKGNSSGGTVLSEAEAEMLTFMREEEKLARDVYIEMFELWDAVIFSNIVDSEQKHMDTMGKMIDKYGLPDPVLPGLGQFTNPDLQEKYFELVQVGSVSYIDGLYVGATIEEIDMVDIQHAIDITSRLDIVNAYQNLLEGSKSHLKAYVGALDTQGFDYSPQFISQELFDAIMDL